MKRLALILVVIVLLAFVQSASAATPTGATYDVFIRGMMAQECSDYCAQLSPDYVAKNYAGNSWWIDPTLAQVNKRFPANAKLTTDEVTRYALAKAWHIALAAQKDCQVGLVRDNFPRFPTDTQFAKCDYSHNPDYWRNQYSWNVAATIASFGVNGAFKFYNDSVWCETLEYRRAFGECGIVTGN